MRHIPFFAHKGKTFVTFITNFKRGLTGIFEEKLINSFE